VPTNTITQNLQLIHEQINNAEKTYSRNNQIKLLAVSKGVDIEKIKTAFAASQNYFAESYTQEALVKIYQLQNYPIEWHFIGPIQANKTRIIDENFSWAHSVDRHKIAERLNAQRPKQLAPLNVCIELNISAESSKSGIMVHDLLPLANQINQLPNLKLRGLMAIPKPAKDFNQQRLNFHLVAEAQKILVKEGFDVDTLSMGMSDDFIAAIAEGATIVRIGSAIFKS